MFTLALLLVLFGFAGGASDHKKVQATKPTSKCDTTMRVCNRDWKHLWLRHCTNVCAYKVEVLLAK